MAPPPLSEFLVQAPGFSQQASFGRLVKALVQGNYDCGVVLTPQGTPLGVIRARRIVEYLLKESLAPVSNASFSEFLGLEREPHHSEPNCRQVLEKLTVIGDYPELLEPIQLVLADQPLDCFWSQVATTLSLDSTVGVLVDGQAQYLGVLAADKVLRFLTTGQSMPQTSLNQSDSSWAWSIDAASLFLEPPTETRLEPLQATLATVLEQLPLALMLQTGAGQILFRNRPWLTLNPVAPTSSDWQPLDSSLFPSPLSHLRGISLAGQTSIDITEDSSLQMARISIATDLQSPGEIWQFVRLPLSQSALLSGSGELFFEGPWPRLTSSAVLDDLQLCSTRTLTCEVGGPDFWLVLALPPVQEQPDAPSLALAPKSSWLLELSHELKSPLTSLLGLSTLLQDPRLGSLNPRQARYARLVQQTARQLIATFNQLLDWFRLDTGQLELFPAVVNLEELGPQVLRSLKLPTDPDSTAPTPETRFSWAVEPEIKTIVADPGRLRQMLHHLISNALLHTHAQAPCGLYIERWGDWLAFTVWDRGPGLPPHQQNRLLHDYYEPGLEGQIPRGASGLGLLLTWHLARLHGGDLTFASSPQGSQFTLLIPSHLSESWAEDASPDPLPPANTTLLLLACNDGEVIELVVRALAATDYRVAIARSAAETLDKAQRLQPALILLHRESFPTQATNLIPTLAATPPVLGLGLVQPGSALANLLQGWLPISQINTQLAPLLSDLLPTLPQDLPGLALALEKLTILYLTESSQPQGRLTQLHKWLHQYHCRVLEVDDLAQAELLVRVWRPQVVLLDEAIANPHHYFQQLTQHLPLCACPLVAPTVELAEAAGQFPQLSVFPCLAALTLPPKQAMLQLMQVLVLASKSAQQP
ncbi:MAG TPA: hybrid sensor histidine kinase/response regulator [Leptolyngbyaceae cyanobacterium]